MVLFNSNLNFSMKKYSQKGFTLIELLVVIAIIGILSSIVLASLSTARNKGKDAAIQAQLASLRSQAEVYANGGSYAALFTGGNTWASASDAGVQSILTGIDKSTTVHTAGSIIGAWAAQAQLVSDITKYTCVDSTGASKTGITPLLAGATVCP